MITFLLAILASSPVSDSASRIIVEGQGTVSLPPDFASIGYTVHGEGKSSNDAISTMISTKEKIESELNNRTTGLDIKTGSVSIEAARGNDCNSNDDDDDKPKISTGPCAIVGYVAEIPITVRTNDVKDAGTMVGIIGKWGGLNPHIGSFSLASPEVAKKQALTSAIADARIKAEAIGEAAHVRIGRVLSIVQPENYGRGQEIIVTARRRESNITDVPIVILNPELIETSARITVTYELLP
jgi:uncharacterized protein